MNEANVATNDSAHRHEVAGRVTTVITSYNKGPYLADAIDSALLQDYGDQEIIVVDDGSQDDTRQVALQYGERIRYIYQENQGCPAAKNTGIQAGNGEFVAILDGDDRWRPGKLTKQVAMLRQSPEVALVFTDRLKFNEQRVTLASNWLNHTPRRGWVLDHLLLDNFIAVSTVVARRRCLEDVGLFNPQQRIASDFDLWLRLTRKYQVDYVDEILMEYRVGIDSIGSRIDSKFDHVMNIQNRFVSEYYDGKYPRPRLIAKATANRLAALGDHRLATGRNGQALQAYLQALSKDPANWRRWRSVVRALMPRVILGRKGRRKQHGTKVSDRETQ